MSGNIAIEVPWLDVNATTFESILVWMISIPEEFEPETAWSIDSPAYAFSIAAIATMGKSLLYPNFSSIAKRLSVLRYTGIFVTSV